MCVCVIAAQELKGLGYQKGKPVGLVGVTELSDAQKIQIKEQQEVNGGSMINNGRVVAKGSGGLL